MNIQILIYKDFGLIVQSKRQMALVLVPSLGCPCFSILLKVAFFQKVRFIFQISQSPKKIFQKTILNLKFKIPTHNIILLWGEF